MSEIKFIDTTKGQGAGPIRLPSYLRLSTRNCFCEEAFQSPNNKAITDPLLILPIDMIPPLYKVPPASADAGGFFQQADKTIQFHIYSGLTAHIFI